MKFRALIAVAALALSSSFAQAQVQKLKFACFEPPQTLSSQLWKRWIDQVNKDGAGVLEIEYFPGGALGRDPRTQLELLQNGVADIAWTLPFFTPGKFPDNAVMALPLIVTSTKEGTLAAWSLYEKGLLRGYNDLVPIAIVTGPSAVLLSTKPIPTIASLSGLKSSASADMQQKILGALGATPVSGFNFNTTAEALQRGSLDVDLMNFTASVSFKQFDVARHALILPIGPSVIMVAMNKASYDKLTPAAKAVIDRNRGMPLLQMWIEAVTNQEESVRAKWRADPNRTYTELTPAEMAKAESLLKPVADNWASGHPNGPVLVKALRDEVARIRAGR